MCCAVCCTISCSLKSCTLHDLAMFLCVSCTELMYIYSIIVDVMLLIFVSNCVDFVMISFFFLFFLIFKGIVSFMGFLGIISVVFGSRLFSTINRKMN